MIFASLGPLGGPLGALLGLLWGLLGRLGAILGVVERSWAVLEASCALSGALLARLGALWPLEKSREDAQERPGARRSAQEIWKSEAPAPRILKYRTGGARLAPARRAALRTRSSCS